MLLQKTERRGADSTRLRCWDHSYPMLSEDKRRVIGELEQSVNE